MFTAGPCDIYACRNDKGENNKLTTIVDGVTTTLELCNMHLVYIGNTDTQLFSLGHTFTGEVELRKHPSPPHAPRPPAEPTE